MKKILGLLQLFVGVSTLTGSLPILINSDAKTGSWQEFLLQGILLLLLVAIPNLAGAYYSLNHHQKTGLIALVISVFFLLYIALSFYFLGYQNFVIVAYFVLAIVELIVAGRVFVIDKEPKS